MSRARIPDIARAAGVSTATVDRALNGRQGVSAANRQRVLQAARELGYLPMDGMTPLPARPAHLEFLIPFGRNAFMHDVARHITDFAATLPLVAACRIVTLDGIGPDTLIPALDRLSPRTEGVGLITLDHARTRAAIKRLCEGGVRVVTIASDVPGTPRAAYVGVENRIAGRTAAQILGMMCGTRRGPVGLFIGSRGFHGHLEREAGFRAVLQERFGGLDILPSIVTDEDSTRARSAMTTLLRRRPDLAGVYCVGAGRSGIVEALQVAAPARRPFVVVHDLTDSARQWLHDDVIDVVIDQNPRLIAEQAVIRLLGAIAATSPLLATRNIEPRLVFRENLAAAAPVTGSGLQGRPGGTSSPREESGT